MRSRWIGGVAAALMMGIGGIVVAEAQTIPQYGQDRHIGVTGCAGSTCHGSAAPWRNSTVLQNEYVTWQRQDPHAKAYQTLLSDQSKRIARNLGLEISRKAPVEETIERIRQALKRTPF